MTANEPMTRLGVEHLEGRDVSSISSVSLRGTTLSVKTDGAATRAEVHQSGSDVVVVDRASGRSWSFPAGRVTGVEVVGGAGNDRFVNHVVALPTLAWGFGGNDHLEGSGGADSLHGGGGKDTLLGHGGDDYLDGGSGNDILRGMAGNDQLMGRGGRDHLNAGSGNDTLAGGGGDDTLVGSAGNDHLNDGRGSDTVSGGNGDDVIVAFGDGSVDNVFLGTGHDTASVDWFDLVSGTGSNDNVHVRGITAA